jgi:hypothetical protein
LTHTDENKQVPDGTSQLYQIRYHAFARSDRKEYRVPDKIRQASFSTRPRALRTPTRIHKSRKSESSYSTGLPIRAPANLGQDKSRSFSADSRSAHTDENTQVPDRTSQSSQCSVPRAFAYRREYTSSGQDKTSFRLGPALCAHQREY